MPASYDQWRTASPEDYNEGCDLCQGSEKCKYCSGEGCDECRESGFCPKCMSDAVESYGVDDEEMEVDDCGECDGTGTCQDCLFDSEDDDTCGGSTICPACEGAGELEV